jgi:hypothetical protein
MITTVGQISITPILVAASASLEEVSAAIASRRYDGDAAGSGWGSVRDGLDEAVGRLTNGRPRGADPELLQPDGRLPRQLRARYYWNEPERSLLAFAGERQAHEINRFRAVDITLAETDRPGYLLALIGERNPTRLRNVVLPALRDVMEAVSGGGQILEDSGELGFPDDDFFRWLLYRATHTPEISSDITLITIRSIGSQDGAFRTTAIGRGADLDRAEVLALVSGAANRFGPAKVMLWINSLRLYLSLEVRADGSFSIFRSATEYEYELNEQPLPPFEESLRVLQDVAFVILPEVRRLHLQDAGWTGGDRDAFVLEARAMLRAYLDD